jgi:hypothetical protein
MELWRVDDYRLIKISSQFLRTRVQPQVECGIDNQGNVTDMGSLKGD